MAGDTRWSNAGLQNLTDRPRQGRSGNVCAFAGACARFTEFEWITTVVVGSWDVGRSMDGVAAVRGGNRWKSRNSLRNRGTRKSEKCQEMMTFGGGSSAGWLKDREEDDGKGNGKNYEIPALILSAIKFDKNLLMPFYFTTETWIKENINKKFWCTLCSLCPDK